MKSKAKVVVVGGGVVGVSMGGVTVGIFFPFKSSRDCDVAGVDCAGLRYLFIIATKK